MSFSDMLGEHTLGTMLQADSIAGFTDVGAVVAYVNRDASVQLGLQVAQIPYVYGGFAAGVTTSNGQQRLRRADDTQRQLDRSVSALGYYPFDPSMRVEVAGRLPPHRLREPRARPTASPRHRAS